MSRAALAERPVAPATVFTLASTQEAPAPPERRGIARDQVKLLVARPGAIAHRQFRDLADQLDPGDLVVINTSATLPAALAGYRENGRPASVHVSTQLDDGDWVIERRRTDGSGPTLDGARGDLVFVPEDLVLRLTEPYPNPDAGRSRLWRVRPTPPTDTVAYLARHGRPIGYRYLTEPVPLRDLQNVYANQPGSAEMASAGRPFTAELIVRLIARGVTITPIVLHAGVSSPELHESPTPERYDVPDTTARLVTSAHEAGHRVIAVGTTVARALETVAEPDASMTPGRGWTNLVLGPERLARVVTGLITGLHAPEASHLLLLEAIAGPDLVRTAYDAALTNQYLWHEFGDSMLFLP